MKPVVTAALALAGAFVAYEVWGRPQPAYEVWDRSPADKAKVGDVVCVPLSIIRPAMLNMIRPGLGAESASPGSKATIFITSVDASSQTVTGRISELWVLYGPLCHVFHVPEQRGPALGADPFSVTIARSQILSFGPSAPQPTL